MTITLLTIGKTHSDFVIAGISEYLKRLKRYIGFSLMELPDARKVRQPDENRQKEAEADLILDYLEGGDMVVLLDERGKEFTSVEFSQYLQKRMASGLKRLVFVIGGPYGFSGRVYDRADGLVSLSKMTFNHEMVRMFFVEQTYRAMTILRGEPYHHQ